MRWISWYFADDDVWCYYELDRQDQVLRQVELQGPDRVPITAAARSELQEQADLQQIQAYEAVYGVLAETDLTSSCWPEPPPQHISRDEFAQLWTTARRYLQQ